RSVQKLPILEYSLDNMSKKAITFEEKCQAFMDVLFKKPPSSEPVSWADYREKSWTWPEITSKEIKEAIYTSSSIKAPEPRGISFLIIQKLYPALETQFNRVYKELLKFGYHPKAWREAIGVVLAKSNRKAS